MTGVDLRAVDELCRLAVAAQRIGCRIHLAAGTDPELRALLDLAGVSEILGECPATEPLTRCDEAGVDLR